MAPGRVPPRGPRASYGALTLPFALSTPIHRPSAGPLLDQLAGEQSCAPAVHPDPAVQQAGTRGALHGEADLLRDPPRGVVADIGPPFDAAEAQVGESPAA